MYSPSTFSARYSPAKLNHSPSQFAKSPLRGLTASRSTTLDTSVVSPGSFVNTPTRHERSISLSKRHNVNFIVDTNNNLAKTEDIEVRIRNLDEKITANHNLSEEKLNFAEDQTTKLEETMGTELVAQQLLEERIVKEMNLVEGNLAIELQAENKNSKESEKRVLSKIENQIYNTRVSFNEEQTRANNLKEEQTNILGERIYNLSQNIKEESMNREIILTNIAENVNAKLAKFKEAMDLNRKKRHENETRFLERLEDVFTGLQNRVQNENERRERSEMQMSDLIEEACIKVEQRLTVSRH